MNAAYMARLRLARIYRKMREAEDSGYTELARAFAIEWDRVWRSVIQ